MASIFRRKHPGAGLCLLSLTLGGCGGGEKADASKTSVECRACHEESALLADTTVSQRDHMLNEGRGVSMGGAGGYFGLTVGGSIPALWVKRGGHSSGDLDSCSSCHPAHASSSYPSETFDDDPSGGKDCAGKCHDWLGRVESSDLAGNSGNAGSYAGSIRPFDLLNRNESRHSAIWRDGFNSAFPDAAMRVVGIRSGCTGCHNVFAGGHGAVPSCTECHGFLGGGSHHESHIALIEAQRAAADPGHSGDRSCAYCHAGFSSDERFKASCYGCHLSAHDPSTPYWRGGGQILTFDRVDR